MKREKDRANLLENHCENWNRCIVVVCVLSYPKYRSYFNLPARAQTGLKTFSLSCLCHPEDGCQYIHGFCACLCLSARTFSSKAPSLHAWIWIFGMILVWKIFGIQKQLKNWIEIACLNNSLTHLRIPGCSFVIACTFLWDIIDDLIWCINHVFINSEEDLKSARPIGPPSITLLF